MEGSVYQRKDGRWVGVVSPGVDAQGNKMKRKYIYAKSKKDAKIQLNNLIYMLQNNLYREPGSATLEAFLNEWYVQHRDGWQETTASLYKMYLTKHILPLLGNIKLKDLLPIHITNFKNQKLNESSPNTVIKYLSLLHKAFDFACKNGMLLTNPVDNVERPKKVKFKPKVYNNSQFMDLLKRVEGTFDEIPIILAGACGLRRGEVFGLRWCDVDFKNKTISVVETSVRFDKYVTKSPKNETSARTIIIPDFALNVLRRYRDEQKVIGLNDQTICGNYKPQAYSAHFSDILDAAGLPHIRFHDLRHFNAVIMMKYNIPDKVAAARMGHAQVQTLREIYQHVLTDMDEMAAEKINGMFSSM